MDTEGIYKVHTFSDRETHEKTKYPTNNSAAFAVLPHTGVVSPHFFHMVPYKPVYLALI